MERLVSARPWHLPWKRGLALPAGAALGCELGGGSGLLAQPQHVLDLETLPLALEPWPVDWPTPGAWTLDCLLGQAGSARGLWYGKPLPASSTLRVSVASHPHQGRLLFFF